VFKRNGVFNPSRVWLTLASAIPFFLLAACSSSPKNNTTMQSAVSFTSPVGGATIDQGQTLTVTVTVTPDPGNKGVTWTLQNASDNQKPAGTLTNQTATSVTYNAPTPVTSTTQIDVVATSVADSTQSATLSVVIEPPPAITSAIPSPLTSCPSSGSIVIPGVGAVANVGTSYISTFTESGGTPPFTWSVNGLPDGLTLQSNGPTQATISGTPTSSVCQQVSLQVKDGAGISSSEMDFVMLVVPAPLSPRLPNITGAYIDPNPPNDGIPYRPILLSASGGVPPYSWTLPTGSLPPPGLSVSSAGLLAGTPSASGLSQNGGLGAYGFTPIVNDTQIPYPAVGVANLSIGVNYLDSSCHTGLESTLSAGAPYAFLLRGFDKNGPVVIAGNFTADGAGNITAGSEDINRSTGAQSNLSIQAAGSSYTVGSDNRGCLTLVNSAGVTTTFRFSLGTCSTAPNQQQGGCLPDASNKPGYYTRGRLIEFDDSNAAGTRGSGILRLQDSTAFTNSALNGMYAFGLSGWDFSGQRYALAGSASASSGSLSSVAADINDSGTLSSALAGGSGTYSVAADGRGTATLSVGSASFNFAMYPVSSGEVILASTDTLAATHPLVSGGALTTTGPFSAATLPNSYMLHMTGRSGSAPDPNIGVLTFDGLSSVSGTVYENQGGTLGTAAISATYFVDTATGRLTIAALQTGQSVGAHPFVAYIIPTTSGTAGFVVSTDASVQVGALEFQALNPPASTFRTADVVGGYFFSADDVPDASSASSTGTISATGTGNQAGNEDVSSAGDGLLPNQSFSGSYSVSKNGTGNFGGETVSVSNGKIVYSLDESPLNLHPTITVFEQ